MKKSQLMFIPSIHFQWFHYFAKKIMRCFKAVSAWMLIPSPANHKPAIPPPPKQQKMNKSPRADKKAR